MIAVHDMSLIVDIPASHKCSIVQWWFS